MRQKSYVRRGIGVAIGCSPIGVAVASFLSGVPCEGGRRLVGAGLVLISLAVAVLNFYLSFLRAPLYHRAVGSLAGYRHISGLPLLGTLFATAGTLTGIGSALCATLALLAIALDTGGSVWFLIATWKDATLWDR